MDLEILSLATLCKVERVGEGALPKRSLGQLGASSAFPSSLRNIPHVASSQSLSYPSELCPLAGRQARTGVVECAHCDFVWCITFFTIFVVENRHTIHLAFNKDDLEVYLPPLIRGLCCSGSIVRY